MQHKENAMTAKAAQSQSEALVVMWRVALGGLRSRARLVMAK